MIVVKQLKLPYGCQANLNLTFNAGQTWGVLGPNGAGKTTLLLTLAGLQKQRAGDVYLQTINIKTISPKKFAANIAILLQHQTTNQHLTCWEYCASARFPHKNYWQTLAIEDRNIIIQALAQVDMLQYSNKTMHKLSGGELKRLAIASVLTQTPHVYLLDEPANHLDIAHQVKILTHFKNSQQLTIMSVHDINHAQQFCDHVLLLYPSHYLAGPKEYVLTQSNLSDLYQHPISAIEQQAKKFWLG
jgi:iron complex transport system ATP-binding protein